MLWTFSERFGPICLMAVVLIVSRVSAQRSHRLRLRTEAQRLRCALLVSLRALRSVYESNLTVLNRGGLRLMSGRSQINLFRHLVGRLIILEESEIEGVLAACIEAERTESAMAVAGKAVGAAAFKLPDQFKGVGGLKVALTKASSVIVSAEELLVANTAGNQRLGEVAAGHPVDGFSHPPLVGAVPTR